MEFRARNNCAVTSVTKEILGNIWSLPTALRMAPLSGAVLAGRPNPSIERTCHGELRPPRLAAHVVR